MATSVIKQGNVPFAYSVKEGESFVLKNYTQYLVVCEASDQPAMDIIYGRWSDASWLKHAIGTSANTINGLTFTNGGTTPATLVELRKW